MHLPQAGDGTARKRGANVRGRSHELRCSRRFQQRHRHGPTGGMPDSRRRWGCGRHHDAGSRLGSSASASAARAMTRVLVRTPLRVSLFGGGTDLPSVYQLCGGRVLGAAIAEYTYVEMDDRVRGVHLRWPGGEEHVSDVASLRHGLVRAALTECGVEHAVAVRTVARVSARGSGLGASSSIAVGLVCAAQSLNGIRQPPAALAEHACTVEIERLGRPVGKQDQYLTALGGLRMLAIAPSGEVHIDTPRVDASAIAELENRTLLFSVGARPDVAAPGHV